MNQIPCKQCICFAICNSRLKDITDQYEIIGISNMLINKCSVVRSYLKKFHKVPSIYTHTYENVTTFNIRPFINSFLNESITSRIQDSALTITQLNCIDTIDDEVIYHEGLMWDSNIGK